MGLLAAFFVGALYAGELTVRGTSMVPLLREGQAVTYDAEFYKTHPVKNGDIVIVRFERLKDPIVKRVHGVAGDDLQLELDSDHCFVKINGKKIKNSTGHPYHLNSGGCRMLGLYVGKIPSRAVLLLGETVSGSFDAARFGLIDQDQIVGKLVNKTAF